MLFSDGGNPGTLPPNVCLESLSREAFNRLASTRLGMEINLQNPYKICDLRPAFGIIFRDYTGDADFWGYSDLDLVYGRLDHFLPAALLEEHDVISARRDYLTGHFALFRNRDEINTLFRQSPCHEQVFRDGKKHFAFDERSNIYGRKLPPMPGKHPYRPSFPDPERLLNRVKFRLGIGLPAFPADMDAVVREAGGKGEIRPYGRDMARSDRWFRKNGIRDWQVVWDNGRLKHPASGQELLHFHFLQSKSASGFRIEPIRADRGFRISPLGITPL